MKKKKYVLKNWVTVTLFYLILIIETLCIVYNNK